MVVSYYQYNWYHVTHRGIVLPSDILAQIVPVVWVLSLTHS